MRTVPRVACINDLSGYGRCSLTIALPVLSVMGVQACPAPTAVLSMHTGFPQYTFTDLTDSMNDYFQSWNHLQFDWIYSGFLGSLGQISIVNRFFESQKKLNRNCCILLDPVMGDDGRRYSTYTKELCDAMRELVSVADVITPNITEACLLTGTVYSGESLNNQEAAGLAEKLMKLGCRSAIITGIVQENRIGNLICSEEKMEFLSVPRTNHVYSGTGDLFASVLCGALAKGAALRDAVKTAGEFLSKTTQYTLTNQTPAEEGILFEPLLKDLGGIIYANEK